MLQALELRLAANERTLADERNNNAQLQGQLTVLTTQAAARRSGGGVVDTKMLGKSDKFNGTDATWKDWKFVARAYFSAVSGDLTKLMDEAESGNEVTILHLADPVLESAAKQLYYCLVLMTTGPALDRVQAAGDGEGALARQMLCQPL